MNVCLLLACDTTCWNNTFTISTQRFLLKVQSKGTQRQGLSDLAETSLREDHRKSLNQVRVASCESLTVLRASNITIYDNI